MISFVYPIRTRTHLFCTTLDSFAVQVGITHHDYEIVVVDDGSTDDLRGLCARYPALPIRYLRIDVDRAHVPVTHDPQDGSHNPAVAWNVGLKAARGTWVALSSPEVLHRSPDNVRRLLVLTRAAGPKDAIIADVYDQEWAQTEFQGWIGGGPKQRPLCFLAAFQRQFLLDLGGMEERFMVGRAYDDNELAERFTLNGGRYVFTGQAVVAEHQAHPRAQPGPRDQVNAAVLEQVRGQRVANAGRIFGHPDCIVETWP
jgi:glycosyltransferase involved in cell wall biosynthesis